MVTLDWRSNLEGIIHYIYIPPFSSMVGIPKTIREPDVLTGSVWRLSHVCSAVSSAEPP